MSEQTPQDSAVPEDGASQPQIERRLAAILAADFAGYSRLMHEDEERTLTALTSLRGIVDQLIVDGKGKIFNTAGDSVLAEFPSVVEANRCAIAIQQTLAKSNAGVADDARMEMRIGINVGDVMVTENDILGDGVNVACRLWELIEPGGICVTRAARDQLRDRVDTAFDDLGEHSVKNIARPIRAFRVIFDRDAEPETPDPNKNSNANGSAAAPSDRGKPEAEDATEHTFWQSVQASDDDAEYLIYLERYPQGAFADLAHARLRGLSAVEDTKVELAFWETVRESENPAMLRAYLEKYPNGEFGSLAEILLKEFEEKTAG